jgi:UDP-N-acetylmuramyl pentapeptide phosphotransferase/UDP-N-acetylglucosamine-1-phosphate transferase
MTLALLGGLLLAVTCYLSIEAVRRYAIRHRVLDLPNPRSSHTVATPRGAGVVIVGATLLTLAAVAAMESRSLSPAILAYLFGATLIAGVGWLDDVRSLSSVIRLLAQLAAAAIVVAGAGWWDEAALPGAGRVSLGWAGLPLALLWLVGLTNAYNFMDGIDGIAGGQAVVAGAAWALIGAATGAPEAAALGFGVALSSAAFLLHNWSPARIFMGDAGSGFLGFTFAALPFVLSATSGAEELRLRLPVAAALLVWPFVLDTLFTVCRRLLRGEHVFRAHRSHLYQRLVIAGLGHRPVATLYTGLALTGSLLAAAWLLRWSRSDQAIALGLPLLFVLLVALVGVKERRGTA